jgi:MFS family permease
MGQVATSPRFAWAFLGFLTLLNVMNFVDRQLIVSFGGPIRTDLGLDLWEFGLLTGLVFVMFYTAVGVVLGTAADVWHRPRLIAAGLLVWSALTAASGLATGFWTLAAARLLIGVGEATLTPAAVSMLGDVFPPRRRGLAVGIYYTGIPLGVGLSLILSAALGPALGGWRPCFYLLGGLGVPLAAVAWFLPDPPRGLSEAVKSSDGGSSSVRQVVGELLTALRESPAAVLTIFGGVAIMFGLGATFFDMIWLTSPERGFTQPQGGLFLGVVFLVGGTAGNLLGGWCGDWFHRRRPGGRLVFLALGQLVFAPAELAFRLLPADSPWFEVAGVCGALLLTFFYGPLFATVQDLVPARVRSTAVAVLVFALNLLGIAPGSFVAGLLADTWKGRVDQPITWALFAVGLAGLLAVPFFFLAAWCYPTDAAGVHREDVPS